MSTDPTASDALVSMSVSSLLPQIIVVGIIVVVLAYSITRAVSLAHYKSRFEYLKAALALRRRVVNKEQRTHAEGSEEDRRKVNVPLP